VKEAGVSIRYLNGVRLRRALIAGAKQVIKSRDHLNAINVFPVADGDTGSNMAGTLGYIVDGIHHNMERSIHRMLRAIADLALAGARGCSGTILAQFFHGLAEEIREASRVSTDSFGAGVRLAVAYPYEAVSEPKEGTILTVLRDWGESVSAWSRRTDDFVKLLTNSYGAALQSLEQTREKLPVLAKAGVVDAGAQGFVNLIGGISGFIANGGIRELDASHFPPPEEESVPNEVVENPAFRYCTQFVVEGSDIDSRIMRKNLEGLGDSLIVAGSAARAKIHIHSDVPPLVLEKVEAHGVVTGQRVEDMVGQFRAAHSAHRDIALVVDSLCDLPRDIWDAYCIHMVPALVIRGKQTYLDKLTITADRIYSMLREKRQEHPHTSQPAPADFKNRYDFLFAHYASILSLSVSSGISGTYDSARLGARHRGKETRVIDTKTASIGIGLLAWRAALAIEEGKSFPEVIDLVERLIPRVRIHFTVPTLEHLVRSGRIGRMKGLAANALNLRPIIGISAANGGKLEQEATVFGRGAGLKKILRIMKRELNPRLPTEFAITHSNAVSQAEWLRDRIMEGFTVSRKPFIVEVTTAFVTHLGEGAVGVSYILPDEIA
jgi:hypothetical protein